MLSPELLNKIDQVFIRASRRVTEVFCGEFESAFRGRGIEFEEFRDYIPGDDVRQIDWNVTARMDKPFVKIFREEREQTVFFLIDMSASGDFGRQRSKREVITEIAALLSFATIKSNDKVGLILFTDRVELFIPPKKGRSHVWHIIAKILSHKPQSRGTSVSEAIRFYLNTIRRPATCFVLSDFWDSGFLDALKIAGFRHDVVAIRVLDDLEKKMPSRGIAGFVDLESGERIDVDLASSARKTNALSQARDAHLNHVLRASGIDFLDLSLSQDPVEGLIRYFMRREKKR